MKHWRGLRLCKKKNKQTSDFLQISTSGFRERFCFTCSVWGPSLLGSLEHFNKPFSHAALPAALQSQELWINGSCSGAASPTNPPLQQNLITTRGYAPIIRSAEKEPVWALMAAEGDFSDFTCSETPTENKSFSLKTQKSPAEALWVKWIFLTSCCYKTESISQNMKCSY